MTSENRTTMFNGRNMEIEVFMSEMEQDSMRNAKLNSKTSGIEVFLEPKTKDNQNDRRELTDELMDLGHKVCMDMDEWQDEIQEVEFYTQEDVVEAMEEYLIAKVNLEVKKYFDLNEKDMSRVEKNHVEKTTRERLDKGMENMRSNITGEALVCWRSLETDYRELLKKCWHPYMQINLWLGLLKSTLRNGDTEGLIKVKYLTVTQMDQESVESFVKRLNKAKILLTNAGYELPPAEEFSHVLHSLNHTTKMTCLAGYQSGVRTKYNEQTANLAKLLNHLLMTEKEEAQIANRRKKSNPFKDHKSRFEQKIAASCFLCRQKGHKAMDCPNRKAEGKGDSDATSDYSSKPFQKGKRKWDKLKERKAPEKQFDKKPRLKCSHCKKPGHDESTCYSKRDGKPASVGAIFAQEIDEGNEIDLNKLLPIWTP